MSAEAKNWAVRVADAQGWPDPCLRRQVLPALAARHEGGPQKIAFAGLAEHVQLKAFDLWVALMELRTKGLIEADQLGGVMTITLAIDFVSENLNNTAEVSVSPHFSGNGGAE